MKTWLWGRRAGRGLFVLAVCGLVTCGQHDGQESVDGRVANLLSTMTLEQKVAQMIQGEIAHVTPEDVRRYGLGSVLNGGGSFPDKNKYASLQDWVALADSYYLASIDTSEGNAGIPVIWGTDAVQATTM